MGRLIRQPSFAQQLGIGLRDALMAEELGEKIGGLFKGQDHSQQFLNASLASGTPATSIPRHGLSGLIAKTGLISPDEQASPDVMNQEKIALGEQNRANLGTEIELRSKLGPANYAALAKDPRFASMLANAPAFAGELPGETKENKIYAYNEKTGDEVALKPGEKPPTGYVTGSFFKKPGETSPFKDWRAKNPDAPLTEWFKVAHSADKNTPGTDTTIGPDQITLGPDGKTHGVYRINNKTSSPEFVPVAAPLGAKAEKGNAMVDSLNDAMATLDDLENSLSVLPEKSGTGSGVAAKASLSYGRLISSDTDVASFDSARSRIIEVANTLRKGNRLNLTEYNAIKAGLPGDHDSQESAGVKIAKERAFLQKILAREKSRGGTASDLGATGITGGDPIAVGHSAASDFLGSP